MKKILPQLFLFLIPALITAVIFIPLLQQNVSLAGEEDYDMGLPKIDAHAVLFDAGSNNPVPIFFIIGDILIFVFIVNNSTKIYFIKNHSPPANTIA